MFSLRAVLRFWMRILRFHGFILMAILFLAFVNEFITQSAPLTSWRFWLAVGLDMVPAIFVIGIILWLVSHFLQRLSGLDHKWDAFQFIVRNRFGKRGFRPFIKIDQGRIPANADRVLTRLGGEGSLIISHDSAAVLQQGGRLTRVVGPGFFSLKPFEKIYDTIDLRPKRKVWPISAMTQEGIAITWELEIQYRLEHGRRRPSENRPYPLLERSVLQAAICKRASRIKGNIQVLDWETLVLVEAEALLRSVLVHYQLDELIDPSGTSPQVPREIIQNELTRTLPKKVADYGAKILDVKLHNLQVDDQPTQQWIKDWQARWQQAEATRTTLTSGHQIPVEDMLRAETLRLPLVTLYDELKKQDADQAVIMMALMNALFKLKSRLNSKADLH